MCCSVPLSHLYRTRGLLPQLMQLIIPLLDLLVERLILDLELFEIDQVETCEHDMTGKAASDSSTAWNKETNHGSQDNTCRTRE